MRKIKHILILAGGDSSRFWPLKNKALFQFLGKSLILYQMELLSKYTESITVVCHKDNAIALKRILENVDSLSKYQIIVQKDELVGQAGAVMSVKNILKGEVLVINANDILDYSILTKLTKLPAPKNKIILFGKKLNEYFPGGYFKFDDKNNLMEVIEKPNKENLPSHMFKLVFDYFSDFDLLIKAIEDVKTTKDDHYEQAINKLLNSQVLRDYFPYEGYWYSLKYSWHVLTMMKTMLGEINESKIAQSAKISKQAVITGKVIIGENVRIGDFAKIVGPSYIGDNTVIGDYSLVRETQIGEDCLIGSFCEIARSYIGNKVFLHRNYVGDSVLADEAMMGAGGITANLRFDGETVTSEVDMDKVDTNMVKFGTIVGRGTKIGVNVTILPGIKIGNNCLIAPAERVRFDIEDNTYLVKGEERNNTKV